MNLGDILKRFLTKLGNETILKVEIDGHIFGQNQDYAISIELL